MIKSPPVTTVSLSLEKVRSQRESNLYWSRWANIPRWYSVLPKIPLQNIKNLLITQYKKTSLNGISLLTLYRVNNETPFCELKSIFIVRFPFISYVTFVYSFSRYPKWLDTFLIYVSLSSSRSNVITYFRSGGNYYNAFFCLIRRESS